jgi:hypothetical protein
LQFVPIDPGVAGEQPVFFSRLETNGMDGFHGIRMNPER